MKIQGSVAAPYQAGLDPNASSLPPAAQLIHDRITELGLDVSTIAGGHGGSIDFADFEALLDQ